MWPYREWVIRALNADVPFDRFTIEQLAGESVAHLGRMYDEYLDEIGWGHVQTLQRTDPPVHSRYRRLLNRALTPPMVKAMMPSVERIPMLDES